MHKYLNISPNFHLVINPANRFRTELTIVFSSGGAFFEKPEQLGLTHLFEHCQLSKTSSLSKKEINRLLFEKDIYRNASTSTLTESITLAGHKNDFREMLDLLINFSFYPQIDEDILNLEKQIVLREITERKGSPGYRLTRYIFENVYKKGSKELVDIPGDGKAVQTATIESLMEIHKRILEESHFVISAVGGGVDEELLVEKITELSKKFSAEKTHPVDMDGENNFKEFKYKPIVNELAHDQSIIVLFMPCAINFGNRHIRELASELLFSYPEGIFYKVMREELGLLYSIGGSYDESLQMMTIRMTGEIGDAKKLVDEASKILLNPEKYLSEKDLEVIKKLQIKRQEMASDNPYTPVEFLTETLLGYGQVQELAEYIESLKDVKFNDVMEFMNEIKERSKSSRIVAVSNNPQIENLDLKVE